MSALSDEIERAVEIALARFEERLRAIIREEMSRGPAVNPDELWRAEQCAKAVACSTAAWLKAHERGTLLISPVRVGKRGWRWRAGDVLRLGVTRADRARIAKVNGA